MHSAVTLKQICAELQQETIVSDIPFTGVSIDSRTLKPGDVFVAIKGPNFDGHDYITAAFEKGAVAALISKPSLASKNTQATPIITVADTVKALGQIGALVRKAYNTPVVAVTGSSGKTTTKEILRCILSTMDSTVVPRASFNNELGVPLTLCQLRPETQCAVIEMGTNHHGEIDYVSHLATPDVAGIINVNPVHLEGLGSLDDIAQAKAEIFNGLREDGTAVLNLDSPYYDYWRKYLKTTHKVLTFSTQTQADVIAQVTSLDEQGCAQLKLTTPQGQASVVLSVPGVHIAENAAIAAAMAHAVEVSLADIVSGLTQFTGVAGRLQVCKGLHNSYILDDSYNASVGAVLAAIDVLKSRSGKRLFVFGDMLEMGEKSEHYHTSVGEYAAQAKLDAILTCGSDSAASSQAFGEKGRHFETHQQLIDYILPQLDAQTSVLVKGARGSRMDIIAEALKQPKEEP